MEKLDKELYDSHNSFLSNPLLLSIMLLTYGQYAEIPPKLSIFFNQAYEALFQKHDAAKGIYKRKLTTNLNIQDFSRLFSAFCLLTYDKRLFRFTLTEALELVDRAQEIVRIDVNSQDFLDDALQGVCLLVEDGIDFAFSHRSFQEYFVALFISKANLKFRAKIIEKCVKYIRSDNVIDLLYELDQELVEELVVVPWLSKFFDSIKCTNEVDIHGFHRYLQKYWQSFGVDMFGEMEKPIMFGGHDATKASFKLEIYLWFGKLSGIFGDYQEDVVEENAFICKYYKGSDRVEWKVDEIEVGNPVLIDLARTGTFFSLRSLNECLAALREIERKHREADATLDDLFGE